MPPTLDVQAQSKARLTAPIPVPFDSALRHAPSSNTAAVVTVAADTARPNVLWQIFCGYDGTPTGGSVKVEDGAGTTVWGPIPITAGGPQSFSFNPGMAGSRNTALVVTLAAGGSGVSGVLSISAGKMP